MSKTFYVYAYLRAKDGKASKGTPYYIGKGCGDRRFRPHRSINLPTDPVCNVILSESMSEIDAFQAEILLIYFYGRQDVGTGILRNLTNGGEGTSGAKHSLSSLLKMKAHKMSIKKFCSQEELSELSKDYISGFSTQELSEKYGASRETITKRLKEFGVPIRTREEAMKLAYIKDPELRQKIGSHAKNCRQNAEWIEKRIRGHRGKKRSVETRNKLRQAWVRRKQASQKQGRIS